MKILKEDRGISLVEVVASIVLLTIILLSSYYLFVQSAKTTKTSEDIIDATYTAQMEMEELYRLSQNKDEDRSDTDTFSEAIIKGTYSKISDIANTPYENLDDSEYEYYLKVDNPPNTQIILISKTLDPPNLVRVIIRVYDKNGDVLKAQMETTLDWRGMM